MNKILKLLVDDYTNKESSAEYKLILHRYCDAEKAFLDLLDDKQKAEYLKLGSVGGELSVLEQDEFAEYIFKNIVEASR